MNLLFIGPSASGKDTQAELLVKNNGYIRVSSGDLIRDISEGERDIHKALRKGMNEGFLPDRIIYGVLEIYLKYLNHENLILSGVVRRVSQIDQLDTVLKEADTKLDEVMYFELTDEEVVNRITGRRYCPKCHTNYHVTFNPPKVKDICDVCGSNIVLREDDNVDSTKKRLEAFHKDNDLILEEYEKRGILKRIDASKSIEEVYKEVLDSLY